MAGDMEDIIHSHGGVKIFIEQEVSALTRVFKDRLNTLGWTLSSTSMVQSRIWTSLSLLPSLAIRLVSAASTKPRFMAKRAEKAKWFTFTPNCFEHGANGCWYRSKPTLAIVIRPTLAKPTLANVKVLVVCEDLGFSELIVWIFEIYCSVFFCVF